MSNRAISPDWFARSFGELYPVLYAHRTVEAAAPEAEFAAQQLNITKNDHVLDLCCGNGRHMMHLRETTPHLTGLDYSDVLLRTAKERLGYDACLVRGDMRALPFGECFDVIVNFFTSFGYFFTPTENRKVVDEVARVLKHGGRFLVDYMNADHVRANLVPDSQRTAGPYDVTESRWVDDETLRVNKVTHVRYGDEHVANFSESVRLYSLDEFTALLEYEGLRVDRIFGDHDGAPYAPEHPRMILVGRKV